jgi:RimJ/RimL family protein N-acetyltransferase
MNKFNLAIDRQEISSQIAMLINIGKQYRLYLTGPSILNGPVKFIVEMDRDKVIGVIGLEKKSDLVTEMRFLAIHPDYRNHGLGKKFLELGIKFAETDYVYGKVRSTNKTNIRNNLRVGMKPVGKIMSGKCDLIIFARRKS